MVALADHLHFGKAAEACFVSQSTFSVGIGELEKTLGLRIIERDNKKVRLTALGHSVAEKARVILRDAGEIVRLSSQQNTPFASPLRLAIIPSILPFILSPLMRQLASSVPNAQLHISELSSEAAVIAVEQGRVDMVLMALPYAIKGLQAYTLFSEPLCWIGHQDQQPPAQTSMADLNYAELILLEEGHCLRDHTLIACATHERQAYESQQASSERIQASSLLTLLELVDNKFGYSFIPQMALQSPLLKAFPQLASCHVGNAPSRQIALVMRKGNTQQAERETLLAMLHAMAPS